MCLAQLSTACGNDADTFYILKITVLMSLLFSLLNSIRLNGMAMHNLK